MVFETNINLNDHVLKLVKYGGLEPCFSSYSYTPTTIHDRVVVSNIFSLNLTGRNDPIWRSYFSSGLNHQLEIVDVLVWFSSPPMQVFKNQEQCFEHVVSLRSFQLYSSCSITMTCVISSHLPVLASVFNYPSITFKLHLGIHENQYGQQFDKGLSVALPN